MYSYRYKKGTLLKKHKSYIEIDIKIKKKT